MIVVGALRAVVTWLVGGYLVAAATVLVPVLAVSRLFSPDAIDTHAGLVALVAAGPVAGLVATWGTLRGVVQGAAFGGARAAPPDLVAAVGRACRAHHVRPPVCWTSPGLSPSAPPVVVRGIRTAHAYLPAAADTRSVDDLGTAVARAVAGGGASALLVTLAVCRWWRVWVDAVRLCSSPGDVVRRGRASDSAAVGALGARIVLLPFLVLAAACAVPAWIAARTACLAVAPSRLQAAAQVFGTVGGRPLVAQEVARPEAFADVVPCSVQRGAGHTTTQPTDATDDGRPTWTRGGRPAELGAGFAAQPLALLALALLVLAPAVGFVGDAVADHTTWPGEQRVTAVVAGVTNGRDDAVLVDVSENSVVTLAVPGTDWRRSFDTARSTFAVGERTTVVVARGEDLRVGLPDVRWLDRSTVQRSVAFAVLPVLLAWGVVAALGRVGTGRAVHDDARQVRASQEELLASREGTDPAAAAAVAARWQRREQLADQRRPFLGWAAVAIVPTLFVGWLGSFPGRWIGGLVDHGAGGRQIGFLLAAALAYAVALLVGRAALRRAADSPGGRRRAGVSRGGG
ncbi:hypothetical protein ACXR2U_22585 [Jatrophihabitans sp. YIM 134969]